MCNRMLQYNIIERKIFEKMKEKRKKKEKKRE
jgi:hypothetical protein